MNEDSASLMNVETKLQNIFNDQKTKFAKVINKTFSSFCIVPLILLLNILYFCLIIVNFLLKEFNYFMKELYFSMKSFTFL